MKIKRIPGPWSDWSERLYGKVLSFRNLSRRTLFLLFSLGLVIRMVGLFALGDADMESFKAWALITKSYGIERMYSVADEELFNYADQKQVSIVDSFNQQRTKIKFTPLAGYWRDEFMVIYPPVSVYLVHLSGMAYGLVSPEFANNRIFHAFINLPLLIVSALITWILYVFMRKYDPDVAVAGALFYWLNPIVILDSPIQGYNNPIITLFFLLTLISLYQKKYLLSVLLAAFSVWVKPQGLLFLPLVGLVCLRETKPRMWLLFLIAGLGISVVALLPFIVSGYTISALLGATAAIRSLGEWSTEVLSARAWNIWWLIQTAVVYIFKSDLLWRLSNFNSQFGVDSRAIATAVMLLVCVLSLAKMVVEIPVRRIYIFLCAAMLAYAYTMVQVNVQYNQFFILIPILFIFALKDKKMLVTVLLISAPWALQLFTYGGLGRDLCCMPDMFAYLGMSFIFKGITVIMSMLNIAMWVLFSWCYFFRWSKGPDELKEVSWEGRPFNE